MKSSSDNFDYPKAWKEVQKLAKDNLPKSVLTKVNDIYHAATDEDNRPQQVKAISYIASYTLQIEEDGLDQTVNYLQDQIKNSESEEVAAISKVILADFYLQYFRNNNYRIADRTYGVGQADIDYKVWSKETWLSKISNLYEDALSSAKHLDIPVSEYRAILADNGKGNYDKEGSIYKPTLYSLLVEKAINNTKELSNYEVLGVDAFVITDDRYYTSSEKFVNYVLDNRSFKVKALQLYQKLLIHLDDKELEAIAKVDLERLQYVNQIATYPESKDDMLGALDRLAKSYRDTPYFATIKYQKANLLLTTEAENKNIKAIELCEEGIEAYPNSIGAVDCQNLIKRIKKPELKVSVEEVYLPSDPILYKVSYKNLTKVYGKIVKLDADMISANNYRNQKEIKSSLEKLSPIRTWEIDLIDNGLYTTLSTESFQSNLDLGSYIMIVSDDSKFNNAYYYVPFHVSNLSYTQLSGNLEGMQFVVQDRASGASVSGAKVSFYRNIYNSSKRRSERKLIETKTSDSNGFVYIEPMDRAQVSVVVTKGNDILDLNKYHSGSRSYSGPTHHSVSFFTDRSIYRPGQVVHFKGLVMQQDANQKPSIVPNFEVIVVLRDANYQELETLNLKSNDFGSINGQFTLPMGGLTGRFTLDAGISTTQIQVEEYKRPTFEVNIDTVDTAYALGEIVNIKGDAMTFAGSTIGGANVSYTVYRKTIYPYWRYYRGYGNPQTDQQLLDQGSLITDDQGSFDIPVTLDAGQGFDRNGKPSFHFEVSVDITDISGETRSATYTLYAGVEPYILSIEGDTYLDRSELKSIDLSAKNHAGLDAKSSGDINIYKLVAPQKLLRNRYWSSADTTNISDADYASILSMYEKPNSKNPMMWTLGAKVASYKYDLTGDQSVEVKDGLVAGVYKIVVESSDGINVEKIITVTDFSNQEFPNTEILFTQKDQSTYNPGETATIKLGSPVGAKILYRVESFSSKTDVKWLIVNSTNEIRIPIKESDRGDVKVHIQSLYDNRAKEVTIDLPVSWSNKNLAIKYETIRDNMLPGSDQEWRMVVSGIDADQLAAEVLVSMYDSSLDMFNDHSWDRSFYPKYYPRLNFQTYGYNYQMANNVNYQWNRTANIQKDRIQYPHLMQFVIMNNYRSHRATHSDGIMMKSRSRPMSAMPSGAPEADMDAVVVEESEAFEAEVNNVNNGGDSKSSPTGQNIAPPIRKNLNETVFFFPKLKTDKDGSLIFSFKMNEALTSWKLQTFAHTKNLQYGIDSREIKTSQPLMIFPNRPRFLRQGDKIEMTAKVANLSDATMNGNAKITFFDALTMQDITHKIVSGSNTADFSMVAGASDRISWNCELPTDLQTAIMYRITASSSDHTDGEENTVVLLSNRQLVTETIPMHVKGGEQKSFTMTSLRDKTKTADPHRYTVELTSHPVWYAIQALPYMMEYPHECTEQIMNRYYSNALASTVANSHPKLKNVFDRWKSVDSDALLSNLSKNEELKSALQEETPWVRDAQSEEAQKRNIGLLFDLNKMANDMQSTWRMLEQRQLSNGGFPWFPGGRDNRFISQYLLEDLGHLRVLGVEDFKDDGMITKAVKYIDDRLIEDYNRMKRNGVKLDQDHLSHIAIHYLYVRSFYPAIKQSSELNKIIDYYLEQTEKYWNKKGLYQQGMLGLALHRLDRLPTIVQSIKASLAERALTNEELGTYWRADNGFYWYQLPIETHAMLMEFFTLVGTDSDFVENTKIWLLKQKQTTNWKTTKATSAAIYALLISKDQKVTNWVIESDLVKMSIAGNEVIIDPNKVEAGTGYFKKSWTASEIKSDMNTITLDNPNESVAWGAAYYQYWEQLDKIKSYEDNPLTIHRDIYRVEMTDQGEQAIRVSPDDKISTGDKVRVRLKVVVDRPMEYVHLKDMRASGMEPVDVISTYKWQDGLGYYQSTKDLATHFFISYLPVGTYVLEYDMRASIPGLFSTGIANIQSMYAPEFGAHSEGRVVEIVR